MKRTDLFRVDDDDVKFMVKYLNTNEKTLNGDVKILKEWMKTQPHLPEIPDEKAIKNFLILNKCSIERAKQSIDMYYTVRSVIPDVYENTNPKFPKMKQVMEIAYCTPLPKLTKEKYRIYLSKMRNKKMIDELEPHDVVGHVLNIEEIRLREDIMFGDVLIFDAYGANFGYLSKYTPTVLWKIVTIYQKVFSIPMKAVIIVNSPPYIKTILSIVKNFVKPKVFQRIQVYQDSSILNKMFPKEILPKDYGGDEKSLEEIQEELKLKFVEYQDRFDQLDMMKVNEELRPQKLKNDEILGFYVKAKAMKGSDLFKVDDEDIKFMMKCFSTNVETLNGDVKILKEWMKTQPHLPEILDGKVIKNFLFLNKCSIERAKQSIDMYYTIRSVIPDVYENINPRLPNTMELMEIMYGIPLPKLTKEKYRIVMTKMRNNEMIDKLEPHNVTRHIFNVEEIRLWEDIMFGDVVIFDLDGATFGFLSKYTLTVLAKLVTIYQKVFSIPLKAVIIINSPPYVNTLLAIVKSFLKPKLFQRIKVYRDSSILNEMFPKEILPKDYGGDEKSLEEIQEELKLKFVEYQDRFDKLDTMRVNEELRPEKLKNDEILGFHGSFKKLSVD